MRATFQTKRTEIWTYVVEDAPDDLTEEKIAAAVGEEWEDLIDDERAEYDVVYEHEEYVPGSLRELQ